MSQKEQYMKHLNTIIIICNNILNLYTWFAYLYRIIYYSDTSSKSTSDQQLIELRNGSKNVSSDYDTTDKM